MTANPTPRLVDLRLAAGAAAAWVVVLVALNHSAGTAFALAAAALALGVLALAAGRWLGRCAAVAAPLALAAFCAALVLAPLAVRLAHARASPLAVLARRHAKVTAELTVRADPRLLPASGPNGAARVAVDARLDRAQLAGRGVAGSGSVLVLAPAAPWRHVLPGQRVRVAGVLEPPLSGGLLAAALAARGAPALVGRPPWWQRAAGRVRAALRTASAGLPDGPRGLLPGLVDGDTSQLDPVLAQRFRVAGLTHLIAVSGTNCSIVTGIVLLLLRRMRAGPRTCAVAGAVVLVGFVIIARPSPSVLRAAFMAGIALIALGTGRQRAGPPLLAATVLGLLLWHPELAADPGFAMSVLATAALLLVAPGWAGALRRHRVPPLVAESFAVAAAAHLVTAPVIVALAGRVSVVAVPANVLAEPVVAPATVLGFCAALVAPIAMPVGTALAWLAGWPCRWLVAVGDFFGGLPGAALPWPSGVGGGLALLGAAAILVWLARRAGAGRVIAGGVLLAALVQIPVRSLASDWPPAGWVFAACDVGQGDALVLPAGPHAAVMIDSGPDPVAVDRCLSDLGITDVPLLVLSHYHLDHVGGIVGVLHGRRVAAVLTGPLAEPRSGVDLVRDALAPRRLTVGQASVGRRLDVGAVRLTVLGPAAAFHGTRSDPNNSSLVLMAVVRGVRVLLPGDAEIEAQQAMLASGADLHADVLKVPHHGSAYSVPAFLAAVHARVAVISVGAHNDYGHPSPILLRHLATLGVPVRRTDRDGDVAITSRDGALAAVSRRGAVAPAAAGRAGPGRGVGGTAVRAASAGRATMATCPPAPRPAARPALRRAASRTATCRRSSCWSATRSCSCRGPPPRSPPASAPSTPTRTCASVPGRIWTPLSWPSCSARRCSAGTASW